jgi:hypothetical protein
MAAAVMLGLAVPVAAQDIVVTTPTTRLGDSYFERVGVHWGMAFGGPSSNVFAFFNQGSAGSAIPPFGGYDPAGDAQFGFNQVNQNGSGFSLGFTMGKGFSRTMTTSAPSVVVPNGGIGSIFDGSFRPFVTGLIPVVGEPGDKVEPYIPTYQPPAPSAGPRWSDILNSDLDDEPRPANRDVQVNYGNYNSTAQQGALSVDEIRRQRDVTLAAEEREIQELLAKAAQYEEAGEISRARGMYRKAIKRTEGQRRYELQLKLESLLDK